MNSDFKYFGPDQSSYEVADLPRPGSFSSNTSNWPLAAIWQQSSGQDLSLLNSPFDPFTFFEIPLRTDSGRDRHQADKVPDPLAQPSQPGDNPAKGHDQLFIRNNVGPRPILNPLENARPRYPDAEIHRQQPDINEQPFRNSAQSLDPTLPQRRTAQAGLILESEFAAAVKKPYNPLWIEYHGLNPSQITFSPSALKFDKLFLEKVITVGDKLVLIPDHTLEADSIVPPLRNVATVLSVTRCPQHFPNLVITSSSSPNGRLLIPRCAGTKQLAAALINEDSRLSIITPSRSWRNFRLYRANVNLGTLWDVRLRYNLWIDQVDAWAVRNHQPRRARRSPSGSNVVFRDGFFRRLVPGGGMVVCEDQHAFDAPRQRARNGSATRGGRRKSVA